MQGSPGAAPIGYARAGSAVGANARALVLGDDTRGFLATVRSLGRHSVEVHAAPANYRAPALRSRYIRAVHRLPPWSGDGSAWLVAMETLLTGTRFDVVFPCNETSLLPLNAVRARFSKLATLAMPDEAAVRVLFDKHETRLLAARLGIPVAPGRLLQTGDDPAGLLREFAGRVVVKPRWSYRLDRLHRRGKVRIAASLEELGESLHRLTPDETLLEHFVGGTGIGVSILAQNGVVRQAFQHRRAREMDGTSYYRVSEAANPAMVHACAAMADSLSLSGIAMFEFRRRPDSTWVLLEVNARPWGSMPLAQALGVDFVWGWYCQLQHGEAPPPAAYRAGIYGRNLMPDLRAIFTEKAGAGRAHRGVAHATAQLWGLRRVLTGGEKQDVLTADDPAPARAELAQISGDIGRRLAAVLPGHSARAARHARAAIRAAWRDGGDILFLCQGNICRSPFAAAALRARVSQKERILSAGLLPLPDRPCPELAVQAASRIGIDLGQHRSHMLDQADLGRARAVLVFDAVNRSALLDLYPESRLPLVLLGDLTGVGEITDPVDGDEHAFVETYTKILAAISALASLVA
jgi:protein-tyrosine-phosphatase/predicted ATP-grasp superfamily ATP-dependent carboligase